MIENSPVNNNEVEIRALSFLKKIFDAREWPFPMYYKLDEPCTVLELAKQLDLPLDQIEAVFINGLAKPLQQGVVKPGDRVAFLPPGTPGPYRVVLGIVKLPGE